MTGLELKARLAGGFVPKAKIDSAAWSKFIVKRRALSPSYWHEVFFK
jgi:hypothetical protein